MMGGGDEMMSRSGICVCFVLVIFVMSVSLSLTHPLTNFLIILSYRVP